MDPISVAATVTSLLQDIPDIGHWPPVEKALQDLVFEGRRVAKMIFEDSMLFPNGSVRTDLLEQAHNLLKRVMERLGDVPKYKEMPPYIRFFRQMFAQRRLVEEINRQTQELQKFQVKVPSMAPNRPSSPEDEKPPLAEPDDIYGLTLHFAIRNGDDYSVKLLLKKGFDVTRTYSEGRTLLHIAAMYGHIKVFDVLLQDGRYSIDAPDDKGMPPLYYAALYGNLGIVQKLLSKNANLDTEAPQRRSVLSYIASFEIRQAIAEELIRKQASLAADQVDPMTLQLIRASASGDEGEIKALLGEGADVNGQDEFGYTALYEAARFGHHEIVKLLIQVGAKPNTRAGLGGDTALHGAIDKGDICQRLIQPFRDQRIATTEISTAGGPTPEAPTTNPEALTPEAPTVNPEAPTPEAPTPKALTTNPEAPTPEAPTTNPEACENYEKVVEVLLQYGVQTEVERWDGLTATDLIGKLLRDYPEQDERKILEALKAVLENPPAVTRKTPPEQWRPSPQMPIGERLDVCKDFKTIVHYHRNDTFRYHISTVDKLIYHTEEEEVSKCKEFEAWASKKNSQWWKWVHLPANNKRWAKDLVRVLSKDKGSAPSWDLEAFIDDSYQEVRGNATYARYRRPSFQRKSDDIFSLVIPYISTDSIESLNPSVAGPRVLTKRQSEKKQRLEKAYRHGRADAEDLHLACTLDQSYYTSLDNSSDRDKDQVVYRFYLPNKVAVKNNDSRPVEDSAGLKEEDRKLGSPIGPGVAKIVMVSQLWLWRIDKNTIITAFPNRWYEDQTPDILGHTVGRIWDSPPSSLDQMIFDIIRQCVGFVDAPANAGLNCNLFDIFEQSIAKVSNNGASSYRKFSEQQRNYTTSYSKITSGDKLTDKDMTALRKKLSEAEEFMCNISPEVDALVEIKDICDELKMIQRVLQDQEDIIKAYCDDVAKKSHEGKRKNGKPKDEMGSDNLSGLSFRRAKADRLYKEAESVEVSLKNLMDLKQKQGNLNESRDTRKLTAEAEKRQLESEKQSRLLFIFTAVTVVYTPMAFTASFFAIPSSDFPRDGSNVAWTWWQIFVGLLVTICAIILVPFIFWIRRGRKGVGKSSPKLSIEGGWWPRSRISLLGVLVQDFMIGPLKNFFNYSLRNLGLGRKRENNEESRMEAQPVQSAQAPQETR